MVVQALDAHPVADAVAALECALDRFVPEAWSGLEPSAVRLLVARLSRVESRVQAQKLHAARRLEATGEARRAGATSTGDLLAQDFGGDRAASDRLVRTSKALPPKSATQAALDAGTVSFPQAHVIGKALGTVPDDKRDMVEQALLKDAQVLNLKDFRRRADRSADAYAERAEVDRIENATLEQREFRARRVSKFRMWAPPPLRALCGGTP